MKWRRIIITLSMIVVIVTAMTMPSFTLPIYSTLQERAELLDELSILSGSNGSYRLDDKLNRSEAAALAVRLLGKELHVLLNANTYKKTDFPDVNANHWYAPYVGYCSRENIINGDTNGNFNPNDFITEKGFLKIVLGILGYKINIDYTWEQVYKKSFEVGLVTDLAYIAKTEDNTNFKRADAVNIIYRTLTLKNKTTDKQLLYNLIDAGTITEAKAVELGLIQAEEKTPVEEEIKKDEVPTEIEEILVFNANNLSIIFNENIESIESLLIYESANQKRVLEYEIDEQKGDYIIVDTDNQSPGVEYLIEIKGLTDNEGNYLESLYGIFIGYAPEKVESNFFRIKEIKPVNEESILIYFTHPVNINVENALHYRIFEGNSLIADGRQSKLIARIYNSEQNCVMLTLNNAKFQGNKEYIAEIDGKMTSAYGVRMNDGKGDRFAFIAVEGKEERFKLNEIVSYNANTIMLIFNKDINPFLASQIYNFYITSTDGNPVQIEKTTMMDSIFLMSGRTLFISMKSPLEKRKEYYLTINNLNDVTRQEYINEMTYSFTADYGSTESVKIESISPVNNQKLEVYFSNALDQSTVIKENFVISYRYTSERINPIGVVYDSIDDPLKVILYLSDEDKLVGNREYQLEVNTELRDYVGNPLNEVLRKDFYASTRSKDNPYIIDAVTVSSDAVKLAFSDALAFDRLNLTPENYTLEYTDHGINFKKVPLNVLYVNSKTLVLKFDELLPDISYTLKFNTLVDYTGSGFKVFGEGTNFVEFKLKENE